MKRADFQNKHQQQQLSHKVSAELPNSWSIKERCKSNVSRVLLLGSGQFKLAVGLLATAEAPMTVAELCDHSQQQQRSQKFSCGHRVEEAQPGRRRQRQRERQRQGLSADPLQPHSTSALRAANLPRAQSKRAGPVP
jgi:hypothetical protein|eukprot:COSAG03_NODE_4790_length_1432_cov_50.881777_2_plen_137_part_00